MTYWYVRHESFFDTWYPEYGTQEKEELWCGDIQAHPGYNLGVSMDEFADAGNSIGNAEEYSAATKCEQAAQYVLDLVPEYTGEHQEALRTLRSAQADKQRIVAHTAKKAQADKREHQRAKEAAEAEAARERALSYEPSPEVMEALAAMRAQG